MPIGLFLFCTLILAFIQFLQVILDPSIFKACLDLLILKIKAKISTSISK
jgi:hypothetical protein